MTFTAGLHLAAVYESAVRLARTPEDVVAVRLELGRTIDLLRTIGQLAIRREEALKAGCDEATFQRALDTAGDPAAPWPPDTQKRDTA